MKKYDVNARMITWILLLQEFDITILDKPGRHNVVAYFLSRLTHAIDKELVDDSFPKEYLFSILVQTPWFSNIANYLATRKLSKHFN